MKNKEPWKPIKPSHALKCKPCQGTGKIRVADWFGPTITYNCNKCGGKGYL